MLYKNDMPRFCFSILLVLCTACFQNAAANELYVDNIRGDDRRDGSTEEVTNPQSGPVASISRALQLARGGDIIHIAKTNVPYYEQITLQGKRHSGIPLQPFTIIGNGAELNGSMPIPVNAWQKVGLDVYATAPRLKGFYLLLSQGKPLKEVAAAPDQQVPSLEAGQWAAVKGKIYVRIGPGQLPSDMEFGLAYRTTGVTLLDVQYVLIEDLVVKHFHVDGINAHDRCEKIVLNRVTAAENGRAGVVVAGSSLVQLKQPVIQNNGKASLLITERGGVTVDDSKQITPAPTVRQKP